MAAAKICVSGARSMSSSPPAFGSKGYGTVAATAFLLGFVCAAGVGLAFAGAGPFGTYIALLAFFHQMEYICVAASRPETLSFDSFVINHSTAYTIAAVASWTEYAIELWCAHYSTSHGRTDHSRPRTY